MKTRQRVVGTVLALGTVTAIAAPGVAAAAPVSTVQAAAPAATASTQPTAEVLGDATVQPLFLGDVADALIGGATGYVGGKAVETAVKATAKVVTAVKSSSESSSSSSESSSSSSSSAGNARIYDDVSVGADPLDAQFDAATN